MLIVFLFFLIRFVECVQIVVKYRYNVLAEMVAAEKTLEAKKSAVKQDMTEIANAEQAAGAAALAADLRRRTPGGGSRPCAAQRGRSEGKRAHAD